MAFTSPWLNPKMELHWNCQMKKKRKALLLSSPIELTWEATDLIRISLSQIEMWLTSDQGKVGNNQRYINLDSLSPRSVIAKCLIFAQSCNDMRLHILLSSLLHFPQHSVHFSTSKWGHIKDATTDSPRQSEIQCPVEITFSCFLCNKLFIPHSHPCLQSNLCPCNTSLHYPRCIK